MEVADNPNLGKFILRVTFGIVFLFNGIQTLTASIRADNTGIIFVVLVIIGYFLAPLAIIIGLFTRFFSVICAVACLALFYLNKTMFIEKTDIQTIIMYCSTFVTLIFFGSGPVLALRAD